MSKHVRDLLMRSSLALEGVELMKIGDLVKHVKDGRTGLVVEKNYHQFLVRWCGQDLWDTWLYDAHVEVINGSR